MCYAPLWPNNATVRPKLPLQTWRQNKTTRPWLRAQARRPSFNDVSLAVYVRWPNPATPAPDRRHHPQSTEPLDIGRACNDPTAGPEKPSRVRAALIWRRSYEALDDFSLGRPSSVRVMALKTLMPCVAAVTGFCPLNSDSSPVWVMTNWPPHLIIHASTGGRRV